MDEDENRYEPVLKIRVDDILLGDLLISKDPLPWTSSTAASLSKQVAIKFTKNIKNVS